MRKALKVWSVLNMFRTILLVVTLSLFVCVNCESPLDAYIYHWDETCTWKLIETYPSETYTVYVINMTSQTWLNGRIIVNKSID